MRSVSVSSAKLTIAAAGRPLTAYPVAFKPIRLRRAAMHCTYGCALLLEAGAEAGIVEPHRRWRRGAQQEQRVTTYASKWRHGRERKCRARSEERRVGKERRSR